MGLLRLKHFFAPLIIPFLLLVPLTTRAKKSEKWFIKFKDKPNSAFDINSNEWLDEPVNADYIKIIEANGIAISNQTKWLNGVFTQKAHSKQTLENIYKLPFLDTVITIKAKKKNTIAQTPRRNTKNLRFITQLLEKQTNILGGEIFRQQNINGQGICIAIFDVGFTAVNNHPAFEHLHQKGRIKKTFDFIENKEWVYAHSLHGTMVLSVIAGKKDSIQMGLAPEATFLLARTESEKEEPFWEEELWLKAMEWAYDNGAKIINSSLGYSEDRYFNYQMDGQTSLISQGAQKAFQKGILIVNAAGNEGARRWKYIITPADVDSVLTVGAIDPFTHCKSSFSSFGPNANFTLKPNVAAYGQVVVTDKTNFTTAFGTSFAAPLVTGFAACVWQMYPNMTNKMLWEHIQKSGHLYPYFDYAHGYGMPQATYFYNNLTHPIHTQAATFEVEINTEDDSLNIVLCETPPPKAILFYHIQNQQGHLRKYAVIKAQQKNVLQFDTFEFNQGEILRIYYRNTIYEYCF